MSTFIPTHQRARVRQRPSLVCSNLQVFHVADQSFLASSRSSLGLFSFNLVVHCKLDLLLAPTASQSDRQNSVALETAEHLQPLLNDRSTGSFTWDWEKENVKKAQCWEKREKGRSSCQLGKALDEGECKRCLRHC